MEPGLVWLARVFGLLCCDILEYDVNIYSGRRALTRGRTEALAVEEPPADVEACAKRAVAAFRPSPVYVCSKPRSCGLRHRF